MSIKANLERAQQAIGKDIDNGNKLELAHRVGTAAIEAITQGMNSVKWEQYMALFCDNADELAQLTVVRPTDKGYMPQMRAYITANAVCTTETRTQLALRVSEDIEPPAGSVVPPGTHDPADVRDDLLFTQLRPAVAPES